MKPFQGWVLAGLALVLLSYRPLPHTASPAGSSFARYHRAKHLNPTFAIDSVAIAIGSGNVRQLSRYLDVRVGIDLPEKSDTYSKSQAEMVIRGFFSDIDVVNFKVVQQGQSSGFFYCTGILSSRSGNFMTTLFLKSKGSKEYLQSIRFQETEEQN